jgi:hypothetical protein
MLAFPVAAISLQQANTIVRDCVVPGLRMNAQRCRID